mmetsp:Transcript_52305/g.138175  ORF Transcript_52305/g.138175 Transcript_52305/m.138175 type:complete len:133 (-) Transcript_52305:486-884(-)
MAGIMPPRGLLGGATLWTGSGTFSFSIRREFGRQTILLPVAIARSSAFGVASADPHLGCFCGSFLAATPLSSGEAASPATAEPDLPRSPLSSPDQVLAASALVFASGGDGDPLDLDDGGPGEAEGARPITSL